MRENEKEEELSFAELFEQNPQMPNRRFSMGDTICGVVAKIYRDSVFVDLGSKSEGIADAKEFRNEDGSLTIREGELVNLRVISLRDGIHLSKGMKVQGAEAINMLKEAYQNRIPVEGRVAAVIKGGFEVEISGNRAFCPVSQIDLHFCEKLDEHVGAKYPFRIMEIKERGKNILVSRRALLQEEQEMKKQEILAAIKPGLELAGKITRLTDFGAFVDIGGIEGMVHISEISHARVTHPSSALQLGQEVKVKVLKIEPDKNDRPRIALSMKALEISPWERGFEFKEGEVISGKVSRLADFGAFVEVAPGVDGLVHISEISYERVAHPSRFLKEGDVVDVLVLKIDHENRRISLSIREAAVRQRLSGQEGKVCLEAGQVLQGIVDEQKPYGLFVRLPQIGIGVRGLLPQEELLNSKRADVKRRYSKGKEIQVEILSIDEEGRIQLSQKTIKDKKDRADYQNYLQNKEGSGKLGTLGDIFKKLKM